MTHSTTPCDTPNPEAISAILTESTITGAAESLGVSRSTVYRWLADASFKASLDEARARAFEVALARLESGTARVIEELRAIAIDRDEKTSTRVTACRAFLETAFRAHEDLRLAARLDAIEARIGGLSDES